MKKFRRILSALLAVIMIAGAVTAVGAANVSFTDVSGHWAWTGGQIPYLVEKGVLNGYKQNNGTYMFKPDGEITRAEFIKILDETFGLTATASISFKDVSTSDWFHPYFAKAAAQGYILNYGSYATPNGKITREEALSLLVRYLDLPADQRASTSYFADYAKISDNFKDYVLRGVYAGLTDGYSENGVKNFKPQKTLSRAEALTILYRAAGCIFKTNAYSRDNGAPADNNVVTAGNITIRGISLNGRNIISEGVSSGIVTYSKCKINGTLYVRGAADVIFDDCEVSEVVVMGGGSVSLLNKSTVEKITADTKTEIKIHSGTSVEELIVSNGADYTTVSGDGSLGSVIINARGFSSAMVPVQFEIGNNLTAAFAGSEYSGSTATQNSFTITPFVTADKNSAYLNMISDAEGELYYYYTNSSYAPSIPNFDSHFDSASVYGHFYVEAGEGISEETVDLATAEKFDYVVMQLQDGNRKYAPVVIENSVLTGTGFTTAPYLSDAAKVKFQAAQGGVIFCYYTNSGTGINQLQFLEEYSETESALKRENSVTSLKSYSIDLNKNYLENYGFVAFMLKTANGQYYAPVVLAMGNNGFTTEPSVTEPGKISFKPAVSGDLYYYYSEDGTIPAAADFKAAYNHAEYADNIPVKKNTSDTLTYNSRYIEEYPYIVMCIREDGEYLQPVSVYIRYSTGFEVEPELRSSTRVRFTTEDYGTVFYYYASFTSKNPTAPTVEEFKTAYNKAKYKDEIDCGRSYEVVDVDPTAALKYPYMVFMFVDENDYEYIPVLLALDSDQATGFASSPSVTKIDRDYYLSFKAAAAGEVWYFYSPDNDVTTPSQFGDDWSKAYNRGIAHSLDVKAGQLNSIKLDRSDLREYPYVIIAFYDEVSDDFSYPIVIDVTAAAKEDSGSGLNNVHIDGRYISAEALFDGRLYWYHTDSDSVPDANEFEDKYFACASDLKGVYSIDLGETYDNIRTDDDYKYVILCLERENGSDDEFMQPIAVNLSTGSASGSGTADDGATRNSYGFDLVKYDPRSHEIIFMAEETGTVTITYSLGNGGSMPAGTKNIVKGKEFVVDYSVTAQFLEILMGGGEVSMELQLKTETDTYKTMSVPIVE